MRLPVLALSLLLLLGPLLSPPAASAFEEVTFPGAQGTGYPAHGTVTATLRLPENGAPPPWPAVVLLHGSGGIDGRGADHSRALQKAGMATLEVFMFNKGQRPRGGHTETLSHAFGALQYLAARPDIDPARIGVMGFSWGGNLAVRTASQATWAAFFPNGGPKFAAHVAFYAVWYMHENIAKSPDTAAVYAELTGAPLRLVAGGQDTYGPPDAARRFMDALPDSQRTLMTLDYYPDATHGFDSPPGMDRTISDPAANLGQGGSVAFIRNVDATEKARAGTVAFFRTVFGLTGQ